MKSHFGRKVQKGMGLQKTTSEINAPGTWRSKTSEGSPTRRTTTTPISWCKIRKDCADKEAKEGK